MKVPRLGTESELKLRPTPQPQQHGIWTAGVTYATAWSNTGSLTHWVRPGIKTVISEWSRLKKQDLFSFLLFSPSSEKLFSAALSTIQVHPLTVKNELNLVSRSIDPSFHFWHERLFSFWKNQRAGKDSEREGKGWEWATEMTVA